MGVDAIERAISDEAPMPVDLHEDFHRPRFIACETIRVLVVQFSWLDKPFASMVDVVRLDWPFWSVNAVNFHAHHLLWLVC